MNPDDKPGDTPDKEIEETPSQEEAEAETQPADAEVEILSESKDFDEEIEQRNAEIKLLEEDILALEAAKIEEEKAAAEEVSNIPTAFSVHREVIDVSVDPNICDIHVTIHIPAGDIIFHEKLEITDDTDTPTKRREWIRHNLEDLMDKHRPHVLITNDQTDVVGKWPLEGEFEEIAEVMARDTKRDPLDATAVALNLDPAGYETKYDIALAIVLRRWRV